MSSMAAAGRFEQASTSDMTPSPKQETMRLNRPLKGQRILVTGANGFIGSHLCLRLCQEGAEVHAVYRTERPAEIDHIHWWQADLSDLLAVRNVIHKSRPEVIFHLASHVQGAPDLEHVLLPFRATCRVR
jgi:nucleoside-diphosphate-sugar epimerase